MSLDDRARSALHRTAESLIPDVDQALMAVRRRSRRATWRLGDSPRCSVHCVTFPEPKVELIYVVKR